MKIAVITDADRKGSGYSNLSMPLCDGLVENGHEIKMVGLSYRREEHWFNFSILPAENFSEVTAITKNLERFWEFDILLVLLDIHWQEKILADFQERKFKYVGVMPIEADPLCVSWAMILMQMDKVFIISQFGADEAQKQGIDAEHILVGIDPEMWKFRTSEDRTKGRGVFGYTDENFVVLTIADNQERKNLSKGMEIFAEFSETHEDARYVLVTREHQFVGWKLQDYAQELGIINKFMILERGMTQEALWKVYAMADVFLLPSKAEGLGLPILESMAVGIPVIGTGCTAIKELITEGGGYPMDYHELTIDKDGKTHSYRDPFGVGRRYIAKQSHGVKLLEDIYNYTTKNPEGLLELTKLSREYVESRDWQIGIEQMNNALKALEIVENEKD